MSPRPPKPRLDVLLVERGLAESRAQARGLIMAGRVRVGGERVDKAGTLVAPDVEIDLDRPPRFVSRGGFKLEGALDHFGVDPDGLVCLDVGASTGGFTDCLLQRGAAKVYAVDVGRGQLHDRVARDERVTVIDRTNAHHPFDLPGPADLATVDVSFISLTQVLPNVLPHLAPGGRALCLVKPQFEAGTGAGRARRHRARPLGARLHARQDRPLGHRARHPRPRPLDIGPRRRGGQRRVLRASGTLSEAAGPLQRRSGPGGRRGDTLPDIQLEMNLEMKVAMK